MTWRVAFLGLITLALAGFDEGGALAHPVVSPSCEGSQSLFHKGRVWFCAQQATFPPETITYEILGSEVPAYQSEVSDVMRTASCLTGARFVIAEHARLRIKIRRDDPDSEGPLMFIVTHQPNARTKAKGSILLTVRGAMHREVGAALEAFIWTALGISKPRLLPPFASPEDAASPETIAGAERVCRRGTALWKRGDVPFCRPTDLPKIVRYAIVGTVAEYSGAIDRSIRSAARLAGVPWQASKAPDVILLFSTPADRPEPLADVLRRLDISPSKALAPVVAGTTFANGSSFGFYGGAVRLNQIVAMHLNGQPMIEVAAHVETRILDVLDVERPAFSLPGACG